MLNKKTKSGFTLIELMVFFIFISLIMAAATPIITKRVKNIPLKFNHGKFICYDDGHYEGMNEGHETGYEEGESEGYETGYQEGYEEGESHMRFLQEQKDSATSNVILIGAVIFFIIYHFEKKKSE